MCVAGWLWCDLIPEQLRSEKKTQQAKTTSTMLVHPHQSPSKAKTLITIQKKSLQTPTTPIGVLHNFTAMSKVLNVQVIEMWVQDTHSFDLVEHYVSESLPKEYVERVSNYHCGALENNTSRSLCKQALKSSTNYYWISKQDRRLHSEMKFHTALSFRIPQGELFSCDIFVVAYAINFITFIESKMNYVALMSYGAALAMYSPSLYHIDSRDINTDGDSTDNNKISCAPMNDEKPIQIRLLQEKTESWPSNRSVVSGLTDQSAISCSDSVDGSVANVSKDDYVAKNVQEVVLKNSVPSTSEHLYQPELGEKQDVDRAMTHLVSALQKPMLNEEGKTEGEKIAGGNVERKVTNIASIFRSSILDNIFFPAPVAGEKCTPDISSILPPSAPPPSASTPSITTKVSPHGAVTISHLQSTSSKAKATTMAPEQIGLRDMESGSVVSGGSSFQFVSVQNLI